MSYFVSILSRVKNIFLLGCQVFFPVKPRFRCIFESHKSPIQKKKFSYRYKDRVYNAFLLLKN